MEHLPALTPNDQPLNFSTFTWAMILLGAATMRLLPVLVALGAVLKLRAFTELRALHVLLLLELALLLTLALIETFALVPGHFRISGLWSFLWVFTLAWIAITWIRSALKTGLRPRWIEMATLTCAALLIFALSAAILPTALT